MLCIYLCTYSGNNYPLLSLSLVGTRTRQVSTAERDGHCFILLFYTAEYIYLFVIFLRRDGDDDAADLFTKLQPIAVVFILLFFIKFLMGITVFF